MRTLSLTRPIPQPTSKALLLRFFCGCELSSLLFELDDAAMLDSPGHTVRMKVRDERASIRVRLPYPPRTPSRVGACVSQY